MKRAITSALAAVLVFSGLGRITAQSNPPDQSTEQNIARQEKAEAWRKAILEILSDEAASRSNWLTKTRFNPRMYVRKISAYDTSKCPTAFQEAWIDYTTAWTELAREIEKEKVRKAKSAAKGLLELVLAVHTGGATLLLEGAKIASHSKEKTDSGNDYLDKVLEATAKCKKLAIHYGIGFHPIDQGK